MGIDTGADDDTVMIAGNVMNGVTLGGGIDSLTMTGGSIAGGVTGDAGVDTLVFNGGTVTGRIDTGTENDVVTVAGATINTGITLGAGDDALTVSSGSITGGVTGDAGTDTLDLTGGTVTGLIDTGTENDVVTVAGATVNTGVTLGAGDDRLNLNSGSIAGGVTGDAGVDLFDINGGTVTGTVAGGSEADHLDMTDIATALTIALADPAPNTDGFNGGVTGGAAITFSGINEVTGGSGTDTLAGRNAATTWTVIADGTGTVLDNTQTLIFNSVADLTGGSMVDTFMVTGAHSGDLTGSGGDDVFTINALVTGSVFGSAGEDRFVYGDAGGATVLLDGGSDSDTWNGRQLASTYTLNSADGGSYVQGTLNAPFSNIENINAGAADDTLLINDGGSLSGRYDGGMGSNTLSYASYTSSVSITLIDTGTAVGFQGTATAVAGGFDNISVATGGTTDTDTLNGIADVAGTFNTFESTYTNVGGTDPRALTYDAFEILIGGSELDRVVSLAGTDEEVLITLTGFDARGYSGTIVRTTAGDMQFRGVDIIIGSDSINDTIVGLSGGGQYDIMPVPDGVIDDGADTFDEATYRGFDGDGNLLSQILYLNNVENLHGAGGNDVFVMHDGGMTSGNLNGGGGDGIDVLDFSGLTTAATLVLSELGGQAHINAGGELRTIIGRLGDSAAVPAVDAAYWNGIEKVIGAEPMFNDEGTGTFLPDDITADPTAYLGPASDGTRGTYLIVQPSRPNTNLIINDDGILPDEADPADTAAVALPDLTEFPGHILIGGAGAPSFPINDAEESFYLPLAYPIHPDAVSDPTDPDAVSGEPEQLRNRALHPTGRLTIASDLYIRGSLGLFGHTIELQNDIAVGVKDFTLPLEEQATDAPDGAEEIVIIAHGDFEASSDNTGNLIPVLREDERERKIYASGGLIATGGSVSNPTDLLIDFRSGRLQFAQGRPFGVVLNPSSNFIGASLTESVRTYFTNLGLSVFEVILSVFNPASSLVSTSDLTNIDTGLFEEELSLFSSIGSGIALTLAQCEEVEGCAPNVSEEELMELIGQIQERISQIKQNLADADVGEKQKDKLRALLTDYEEKLRVFLDFQKELNEFLYGDVEEDDGFDEIPLGTPAIGPADDDSGAFAPDGNGIPVQKFDPAEPTVTPVSDPGTVPSSSTTPLPASLLSEPGEPR